MSKKTVSISIVLVIIVTFFGSYLFSHELADDANSLFRSRHRAAIAAADTSVMDKWVISVYDEMMRRVGAEEGMDWVLMSAIAYNESRFDSDLVSKQGAIGLMQVMPIVGKHFNVDKERIMDPETNIRLAGKLLKEINSTLKLSNTAPVNDRMSIILACYNGGIGHVTDARRLARSNGEDPNSWEVVARYLQKKADPEIYESELVRHGKFTGSRQTEAYVRDVIKRYNSYQKLVAN